jgi:type IV pilus assembly protein PilY1
MNNHRHSPFRRCIAGALSLALAVGPMSGTAYAALTPLADVPIAAKVSAKPNIVYSLDDSGSMDLNYLPDFTVGTYRRTSNGRTIGACASGTPPTFSFAGIPVP